MKKIILIFTISVFFVIASATANEDHHDHQEHSDENSHEAHGSDHEEESTSSVGPDKGILAASKEKGISLSEAALKNFDIKTQTLLGPGPWTLPASAKVSALEEVNLYRLRDGHFKRIDFKELKKSTDTISVSSSDLKPGDSIVVNGVGFLRIAELAAFGGAAHGHSH